MSSKKKPTILLIGNDTALNYLLDRFAERSGYKLSVNLEKSLIKEINAINPAVVIFSSTEILETLQTLVEELANLDFPIMVCSSIADEAKARELGADYCLLHPLIYDDFQKALTTATTSKQV